MKAKCINASGSQGRLTKGKVYDVERSKGLHRYYTLTDDTGHTLSVPSWRFKETSNIDKLIMAAIDRIASDHTQFYKGNIGHATCVAIESEMRALLAAAGLNESEPIKEAKAKTYVRFEYGQEDHGPFEYIQMVRGCLRVEPVGGDGTAPRELARYDLQHGMWQTDDGQVWSDFVVYSE